MKSLLFGLALCVLGSALPARADIFIPGDDRYGEKQFGQARQTYLGVARDTADTSLSAAARFRAALCLYDLGDYDGFAGEARTLLKQNQGVHIEKTVLTKHRLAQLPFIRGDWAGAAETLGQFLAEHPRCQYTFDALNNRAKALGKLGRGGEGRQLYLDYIQANPQSVFLEKAKIKAALCLYELGENEAFVKEVRAVLKEHPANKTMDGEWLRLHLAQAPGRRGQWVEAARQLESLLRAPPQFILEHVRLNCGRACLMAAGQTADAAQARELRARGTDYLRNTRLDLERQIAQGKKKPDSMDARVMILESYYYAGDYQGLDQAARQLVAAQPPRTVLWAQGMLWLGIARFSNAAPDYKGAAEAFDAILGAQVHDSDVPNHVPSHAAYWRLAVAQRQKDAAAVKAMESRLVTLPDGPIKTSVRARLAGVSK